MGDKLLCHIFFTFRTGPWGGCNQFLTALREQLRSSGNWADSPDQADVILIDSFNDVRTAMRVKRRLPGTPFVHRVDGPISIYRGKDRYVDRLIHAIGARITDGVVFQSQYSLSANLSLGMRRPERSCVINNAANNELFRPGDRTADQGKTRLIAVSWSSHPNKGFDVYSHLDRHLDFSRYDMTFVGNSPVAFENIRHIPPQDPPALAELLRASDIYINASRHESCSNSFLEALSCGLPTVAIRSGSNPEILGTGGELFSGTVDVLERIDRVASDIAAYRAAITQRNIADVAGAYLEFFERVRAEAVPAKRLSAWGCAALWGHLALRRVRTGWDRIKVLSGQMRPGLGKQNGRAHAPE